ncbi:MAG TPA: zinc-binding dehydrogenase [Gemmatimonadales bacterium]|nr:zinc-binding dehydrogenase [Gemmatimonadales bacterium]
MRALTLTAAGGIPSLLLQDVPPPPAPAPGWVVVRVRMAALNHLDLFVAEGLPGVRPPFPFPVGADGAGTVAAVGPGVTAVRPGDEVLIDPGVSCGTCRACRAGDEPLCERFGILGEHLPGTLAEFVAVPAVNLAPRPPEMPWPQSAAFSLATLTAWRMLVTRARLAAGEAVLVWGAGGGVAQAAIAIAVHLGARVIATSSRAEGLERARALGAAVLVDHAREDIVAAVKAATEGRGADVVVDSVGRDTWERTLRAVARGGRIVTCGGTSGPELALDVRRLFWRQWSILGSTMGSHAEYRAVTGLAQAGKLWPVVDAVVPLADAAAAFERLAAGRQTGKLVIEVSHE